MRVQAIGRAPPSAASASVNARMRKSLPAHAGIGAVEPIEKRRDVEQPVRFSMKYSSTSSVAVSGDSRAKSWSGLGWPAQDAFCGAADRARGLDARRAPRYSAS